jgi:hypothetical protein
MSFFNAADSVESRSLTVEMGVATNLTAFLSVRLSSSGLQQCVFDSHLANPFVDFYRLRQLAQLLRSEII